MKCKAREWLLAKATGFGDDVGVALLRRFWSTKDLEIVVDVLDLIHRDYENGNHNGDAWSIFNGVVG